MQCCLIQCFETSNFTYNSILLLQSVQIARQLLADLDMPLEALQSQEICITGLSGDFSEAQGPDKNIVGEFKTGDTLIQDDGN